MKRLVAVWGRGYRRRARKPIGDCGVVVVWTESLVDACGTQFFDECVLLEEERAAVLE